MKKRKTIIILTIVGLLVVCGVVWAFWDRTDPQLKKVREMGKELFGEGKRPNREQMEKFHEEMRKLTPEQHRELRRPMHEQMMRRMNKTVDDYFALPPDQRKKYLDKQIQEGERHRKEREQRRREREAAGGPSPRGPRGPGMGPNQAPPPAGANAAPRGPRGGRNRTPEERAQRRNRRLDHISPERRAKWTEYRDAMRKRRIELGLPANPWGRGPRGR